MTEKLARVEKRHNVWHRCYTVLVGEEPVSTEENKYDAESSALKINAAVAAREKGLVEEVIRACCAAECSYCAGQEDDCESEPEKDFMGNFVHDRHGRPAGDCEANFILKSDAARRLLEAHRG